MQLNMSGNVNDYVTEYVITSKNRKYINKRIDMFVKDGWKLKSQSVDKDGFIRTVMVMLCYS